MTVEFGFGLTGRALKSGLRGFLDGFMESGDRRIVRLTTCSPEGLDTYQQFGSQLGIPVRVPLAWQDDVAELEFVQLVITKRKTRPHSNAAPGEISSPWANGRANQIRQGT